jgi:hypothetical protein
MKPVPLQHRSGTRASRGHSEKRALFDFQRTKTVSPSPSEKADGELSLCVESKSNDFRREVLIPCSAGNIGGPAMAVNLPAHSGDRLVPQGFCRPGTGRTIGPSRDPIPIRAPPRSRAPRRQASARHVAVFRAHADPVIQCTRSRSTDSSARRPRPRNPPSHSRRDRIESHENPEGVRPVASFAPHVGTTAARTSFARAARAPRLARATAAPRTSHASSANRTDRANRARRRDRAHTPR